MIYACFCVYSDAIVIKLMALIGMQDRSGINSYLAPGTSAKAQIMM